MSARQRSFKGYRSAVAFQGTQSVSPPS